MKSSARGHTAQNFTISLPPDTLTRTLRRLAGLVIILTVSIWPDLSGVLPPDSAYAIQSACVDDGRCTDSERRAGCPDCQPPPPPPPTQEPPPSAVCGNGACESGENPLTCPTDCPHVCGDTLCGPEELNTCEADCPPTLTCGDGVCTAFESYTTCPTDCPPPPTNTPLPVRLTDTPTPTRRATERPDLTEEPTATTIPANVVAPGRDNPAGSDSGRGTPGGGQGSRWPLAVIPCGVSVVALAGIFLALSRRRAGKDGDMPIKGSKIKINVGIMPDGFQIISAGKDKGLGANQTITVGGNQTEMEEIALNFAQIKLTKQSLWGEAAEAFSAAGCPGMGVDLLAALPEPGDEVLVALIEGSNGEVDFMFSSSAHPEVGAAVIGFQPQLEEQKTDNSFPGLRALLPDTPLTICNGVAWAKIKPLFAWLVESFGPAGGSGGPGVYKSIDGGSEGKPGLMLACCTGAHKGTVHELAHVVQQSGDKLGRIKLKLPSLNKGGFNEMSMDDTSGIEN